MTEPTGPRTAAEYGDAPLTDVLIEMRQFVRQAAGNTVAPGWVSMIAKWEKRLSAAIEDEARAGLDVALRLLRQARPVGDDKMRHEWDEAVDRLAAYGGQPRSEGLDVEGVIRFTVHSMRHNNRLLTTPTDEDAAVAAIAAAYRRILNNI